MTSFDYMVLAIIGLSIVVSMMRGAVKEMLAIFGWVAAFYVAKTYSPLLAPLLPQDIPTEALKTLAAFLILLVAVLLINSFFSVAVSSLVRKIGLGWLNRFLGVIFGFAKGLLVVCVLVFLAGLTSLPKEKLWTDAMFSSPLEVLVKSALPWLPGSVTKHVKFD
ncbi:MAG: colicin V production protein [Methylophilaceae bacterium]|nr:MAG: colicin V production protein [Methylophilaceae bacterium]